MLLGVLVSFGYGVLSVVAPAPLAVLPAYLGLLSSAATHSATGRPRRLVRSAAGYAAGYAAVIFAVGCLLWATGADVGPADGLLARAGGVAALAVALGLAVVERRRGLPGGVALVAVGVLFAAVVVPSTGRLLATAVSLADTSRSAARGVALLVGFAAGATMPFVVAALVLATLPTAAGRLGRQRRALVLTSAGLLTLLAVVLLAGRYAEVTGPVGRVSSVLGAEG